MDGIPRPTSTTRHTRFLAGAIALALLATPAMPALLIPPPAGVDQPDTPADQTAEDIPVLFYVDPPTPSGIGVHVNMPIIRGSNSGWDQFAQIVDRARAGGYFLLLNNMDRPRQGNLVAPTFDNWSIDELLRFAGILVGSRVPVRLYVGAIEQETDDVAVGVDRLLSWHDDVEWVQHIAGARAGLVIDASSMGTPNSAPDGRTRFEYFTDYARAMLTHETEVGFEAMLRDGQNRPFEDRRYYSLLQHIVDRYSTLPESADHDARIMSAVDALPAAINPRRNTIWLENATWNELADGDFVPQSWLNAWGVSPDELQAEAASRLYQKGYCLILPPSAIGVQ